MIKPLALGSLFLLSTALVAPAAIARQATGTPTPAPAPATAQSTAPATPAATQSGAPGVADPADTQEQVEISTPGAGATDADDIVVTGRYIPNAVRATPEVLTVLSAGDIARTGEGDIAGALQRVTGLSVVGNGFVYVRGLGDRYSLSLLNGSPLPSPEPLRRVVPLDIFPTSVIASALVQKSYSVNYPGEFGGGVINLTTTAIPTESFLNFGASVSGDSITSLDLGYTYFGSRTDFLGYDNGPRKTPGIINAAGQSGSGIASADLLDFTNSRTTLLQRTFDVPLNFAGDVSAGRSWDVPDGRVGLIVAAGINNSWRTRAITQQATNSASGAPQLDFDTVLTDNRVVVNGLVGVGAELGDHKLRITNLYIHDALKQGRLSRGTNAEIDAELPLLVQNTRFFERQLADTQGVAELRFGDLSIDLRGTYANSKRDSPYERSFSYVFSDVYNDFVNDLSTGTQSATIAFSELNEDVVSGGGDVSYKLPTERPSSISVGYNYSDTDRTSSRYAFRYVAGTALGAAAQQRPDFLLSDASIQNFGISLQNQTASDGAAAYDASLRIHGAYAQVETEALDGVRLTGGVRYETALERVTPTGTATPTRIDNSYWLPAATFTWNFVEDMQLRFAASKTIARPQFRELAFQRYQDFESDRTFLGNPFLQDSQLYNLEARYEYYFGRGQQFSIAGFHKRIENPIEAVASFEGGSANLVTGFANAPRADLYGGEVELVKYVPLDTLGAAFATQRLVLIGNYTYTKSELKLGNELVIAPESSSFPILQPAGQRFRDGAPLTGQSDHLVNAQIGVEDTEKLQQITFLLTYASERVTNRGPVSSGVRLPDLIERPGIRFDIVARQGLTIGGYDLELKVEGRNLTGRKYEEFQRFEDNRLDINTYDVGRAVSIGLGVKL